MYTNKRMGGWLLFLVITKWCSIIWLVYNIVISTVYNVQDFTNPETVLPPGASPSGAVIEIIIYTALSLIICAAWFVQFLMLKNKSISGKSIKTKEELVKAFIRKEILVTIVMCVLFAKYQI